MIGSPHRSRLALLLTLLIAASLIASKAFAADDELLKGVIDWEPGQRPDANTWDKTDYWCAIAVSPSTGKYASSCGWTNQDNATRQARKNCDAKDAKAVVLCCNGWSAIATGKKADGKEFAWGVGWGPDQKAAEKFALEGAHDDKVRDAKVVFSINARESKARGAIAFSATTGDWGYAAGGPRSSTANALGNCKTTDAKVVAEGEDCWMALALGDDKAAYGYGHAGNRIDAERLAVEECNKRTKNAKAVVSFCTNGVEH